jgi:hypothetical protein
MVVPTPAALLPPVAFTNPPSIDMIVMFDEDAQPIPAAVVALVVKVLEPLRRRVTVLASMLKGVPDVTETETSERRIVPW